MILDFLNVHRADLQYIASLLLGLAMWRWGAGPERAMAILFTGVIIMPAVAMRVLGDSTLIFDDYLVFYVILDIVALIGFVLVGLNANRNYPLWVAAFQIVAVASHLVKGLVDTVSPIAYLVMAAGPSYCQLMLLLAGLLRHRGRMRRFGSYRDWRSGHGLPRLAAVLSAKG